jgi:hypothetical protein
VNVNLARTTFPGPRRDEKGNHDAEKPLKQHQLREKLIGLPEDLPAMLLKKFFRAVARRFRNRSHRR